MYPPPLARSIGEATNNIAEYRALLRGIELAVEHGATDLEVIGDSQLVVRQIEGAYKVKKAELKPLHAQAVAADQTRPVSERLLAAHSVQFFQQQIKTNPLTMHQFTRDFEANKQKKQLEAIDAQVGTAFKKR